jgi:hypothetical protein
MGIGNRVVVGETAALLGKANISQLFVLIGVLMYSLFNQPRKITPPGALLSRQ